MLSLNYIKKTVVYQQLVSLPLLTVEVPQMSSADFRCNV